MVNIKIKKLAENAVVPKYSCDGDACFDLVATSINVDYEKNIVTFGTGISMQIPKGYAGKIYPRSSIYKTSHWMRNCVGIIDSGYRGEIFIKMSFGLKVEQSKKTKDQLGYCSMVKMIDSYKIGDRVAQMMIVENPRVTFTLVDSLEKSERGEGGFGSTGQSDQTKILCD